MYENNNISSDMIESVRLYLGYHQNDFRTMRDSFSIKIIRLSGVSEEFTSCTFGECKIRVEMTFKYDIDTSGSPQVETFKGSQFEYGSLFLEKYISSSETYKAASRFKVELDITSSGPYSYSGKISCKTNYLSTSKWPSVLQCDNEGSGMNLELIIGYDHPYSNEPPSLKPLAKAH